MYGLPKIHKHNNPLRPIVSHIDSPTYKLAKHLVSILSPLRGHTSAHVKDSYHFVETLRDLKLLHNETMVSFDIESLFTNLPLNDCLDIIAKRLREQNMSPDYVDIVKHCLTSGYLMWKDEFYVQVDGVAMGSPVSPIVADIFMEDFEERALANTPVKPRLYKRYATHTDRYLNGESHHHPSQLLSVGKCLFQRAQRLCDDAHLEEELQHVKQVLHRNKLRIPRLHHKNKNKTQTVPRQPAYLPYVKGVTDRISRILKRASIHTIFKPHKKIQQFLRPIKSNTPLQDAGIYK
ncbi:uncharacterized protein LOC125063126, partial [Pieris napi]|uniref:uncharacterized protein LOC125063125 n=1 Tax=Pieris napi TaxID=78633 RepID=UPI001FBACACB